MNELSVSKILERVVEIANVNNDESLKKWAYLELEGYYASNRYFADKDIVPEYREVAGEHRDIYGKTLLISDPELSYINIYRLRNPAIELESLSKKTEDLLSIKDPHISNIICKYFGVSISGFVFNPSSVDRILNSIKQEAVRRSEKYVTRNELTIIETNCKVREIVLPREVTCSWLWRNIPIRWWLAFFSLLFGAFSLGLYVSGIPQVKKILHYIPGYKIDSVRYMK
jgi:hypothetical protein